MSNTAWKLPAKETLVSVWHGFLIKHGFRFYNGPSTADSLHYCQQIYPTNLWRDAVSNKMTKKFFVMKCKNVFDQAQHVDWWVWKIFKPMLAPACYNTSSLAVDTYHTISSSRKHHHCSHRQYTQYRQSPCVYRQMHWWCVDGRLTDHVSWLGLTVGSCWALSLHSSNEPSELSQ